MLDMRLFRDHADVIRADHAKRGLTTENIDRVLELDAAWKKARYDADQLRKQRNQAARGIAEAKKEGDAESAERIISAVAELGANIEALGQRADELESERDALRMRIPNVLHDAVPVGPDSTGNTQHSLHGEKPEFDFEPRTHNEIAEMNNWVELARAAKITGSRFYFLKGDLARLEMALQQFGVDFMIARDYNLVQPPSMMNRRAYEGVTDLADFETVMYDVQPDGYYLIATSEHPLTALYMDEVIEPHKTDDLSDSQPTKGNIEGGLTTIEEKAFGNLEKIGKKTRYIDVLGPAEAPKKGPGLYFMDSSSAAAECVTLQAAAGFVVHLFPTGQGNIIGNPIEPVIKLSANPRTVRTMGEHVDLDVSGILRREMTLNKAGEALIDITMRTCNGRLTAAETLGHREFVLTKLYRSA